MCIRYSLESRLIVYGLLNKKKGSSVREVVG